MIQQGVRPAPENELLPRGRKRSRCDENLVSIGSKGAAGTVSRRHAGYRIHFITAVSRCSLLMRRAVDAAMVEQGCALRLKDSDAVALHVSGSSQVVGVAVFREIREAFRFAGDGAPLVTADSDESLLRTWSEALHSASDEPISGCFCGLVFIWVAQSHRRSGIATELIDIGRSSLVYGVVLPRDMVAFSEPTSAGKRLALCYTGTSSIFTFSVA